MNHHWDLLLSGPRRQVFAIFVGVVVSALVSLPEISFSASVEFPDKLEFVQMLKDGKFKALDARIAAYQKAYEAQRASEKEDLVVFILEAFRSTEPALEPKFNQWIEQMPKSYSARLARGRYYRHLGWSSRGAASAGETSRERIVKMQDYFAKAVQDYQDALSLNPKLSVAYASLIEIAMAYGARKSIEDFVQQALKVDPYSFEVGRSYVWSLQPKWGGSLATMIAFVTSMNQHLPKNPGLAALRGYVDYTEADILTSSGKQQEAIEFYDRAVRSGPHWRFVYERGDNYYLLKAYDKALADFNLALKLWPQHPWPLTKRGLIHLQYGRDSQAMEDLNLALKLDPLNPEARWSRALLLAKQLRAEEALGEIENAFTFGAPDRHTACAVVDALDNFLVLCEHGAGCSEKRQQWVNGAIAQMGRSFRCPEMFLNWRHVWRILKNGF